MLGTNVEFDKLVAYDAEGRLLDTRSYFVQQAGGDAGVGLADFAAAQDAMLVRREAFEDLWEGGREFLYGAVNAGGIGVEEFGPICLVVTDASVLETVVLAVFPFDTARGYTDASGAVDAAAAQEDATGWDAHPDLAVLAFGSEAIGSPSSEWPAVVCRNDQYLEVVVADSSVRIEALAEARLRRALRERLDELRARWLAREPLTDVERSEAAAYHALHGWRKRHGIAINDVV